MNNLNRRNFFSMTAAAIGWLLTKRPLGKASRKAVDLSNNGIISPQRTPWLLGAKVYVDGKFVPRVQSVNTTKGYVVALGDYADKTMRFTKQRIYGYIDIDDSDCMTNALEDTRKHSVTS
jgi:hypothetical protein